VEGDHPTEAVVFRKIERDVPTLLLDETDAIFGNQGANTEGLRALLNAGNRRGTTVPRCVGVTQELQTFKVFCPKALAGIGRLPDTVADRSIPITMKRKAPGEHADRFRRREALELVEPLYTELTSWGQHHADRLADARPKIPGALDDRAEEAWEPLLAIAELSGVGLAERARIAAVELSGDRAEDDESIGVRLLRDIRAVFTAEGTDRISSRSLVAALAEMEGSPWPEWRHGNPLSANSLARILYRYRITPTTIRFDDETIAKGYKLTAFEEEWTRYLSDSGFSTVTPAQPSIQGENEQSPTVTSDSHVTVGKTENPAWITESNHVTVENAEEGTGAVHGRPDECHKVVPDDDLRDRLRVHISNNDVHQILGDDAPGDDLVTQDERRQLAALHLAYQRAGINTSNGDNPDLDQDQADEYADRARNYLPDEDPPINARPKGAR
jgi:hypothetical protein